MSTLHVVPVDDLVEHESATDQPDCACGPTPTLVQHDSEPDHWLIVHHALDGRP